MWGKSIRAQFLAGFMKPSTAFYNTVIPIGQDGQVDTTIKLPNQPFPTLNGDGITLSMQPMVRQGPLLQVILLPKKP